MEQIINLSKMTDEEIEQLINDIMFSDDFDY